MLVVYRGKGTLNKLAHARTHGTMYAYAHAPRIRDYCVRACALCGLCVRCVGVCIMVHRISLLASDVILFGHSVAMLTHLCCVAFVVLPSVFVSFLPTLRTKQYLLPLALPFTHCFSLMGTFYLSISLSF